jgi:D-alanyl-D-alanine carboxypeptidase/D-alanyl-D-alanine-endopeptidase (penicillin-binding protein 4)
MTLANVLRLVSTTDPARFTVMFESGAMPTSGVDGTLKAKFHRYSTAPSSCAKGSIRAKTGTLHDTIALSGTTHDADSQLKVFSFLVNHRPTNVIPLRTRQAIDGLAATITGCW